MNYTIKHFDTPLIRFSADSGAEMNIEINGMRNIKSGGKTAAFDVIP